MDKYTYYITDNYFQVYPANQVEFSIERESGKMFYRTKITNEIVLKDRNIDGKAITDYTDIKNYESQRYVPLKVYKLNDSAAYDLFMQGYLDLTGEWDEDNHKVVCNVITRDDYYFASKLGNKKFNILQLGLTAKDIIMRVDAVDTTISNCYYLNDILELIFLNIYDNEDASFTSQFLTSSTNPVTLQTSETNKIYICNKQSVTDTTSEPEVLELSFDDIMNYLQVQFDVYWYISSDALIVEHRQFFENDFSYATAKSVGLDLTDYTNNGKSYSDNFIKNKKSYTIDSEQIYNKEGWKYQEYQNVAFRDAYISYDINKIEEREVLLSIDVSNDIEYIIDNSDVSNSGVCFLACETSGLDTIIIRRDIQISVNEFQSFNNFSYNTFKFVENEIKEATGIINQYAHSNQIPIGQYDSIVVSFNMTLLSGTMPKLYFINTSETIVEGENSISFTKTTSGTSYYYVQIIALGTCSFKLKNFAVTRVTNKNIVNAPFAWSDLLWKYHKRGRILSEGYMNGILTPFESGLKLKQGEIITAVPINDFTETDLIKTDLGEGELKKATFNDNNIYDLEVIYDT